MSQDCRQRRDGQVAAAQGRKIRSSLGVLLGFSLIGVVLSVSVLVLNLAPKGRNSRIYTKHVLDRKGESYNYGYSWYQASNSTAGPGYRVYGEQLISFYVGVWFGITEFFICMGAMVFAINSIRKTVRGQRAPSNTFARVSGPLLTVLFGFGIIVALGATACGAVTFIFLLDISGFSTCTDSGVDGSPGCICSMRDVYVMDVPNCEYAQNVLSNIYITITGVSGFLAVLNIVIAVMLCAILDCCCGQPEDEEQVTAVPCKDMLPLSAGYSGAVAAGPLVAKQPAELTMIVASV